MKLFKIAKGKECKMLTGSGQRMQIVPSTMSDEEVFELEEVVIDPVHPDRTKNPVALGLATCGWFGFKTSNGVLVVHCRDVEVL